MTLVLRGITLNEERISQPPIGRFDERGGTVGRSDDATLTLPDPERMISRVQAQVLHRDGHYWIENVSAATPILHNGRPLSTGMRVVLREWDELRIGGYALQAAFENDAASATILRGRTVIPGLKDAAAVLKAAPLPVDAPPARAAGAPAVPKAAPVPPDAPPARAAGAPAVPKAAPVPPDAPPARAAGASAVPKAAPVPADTPPAREAGPLPNTDTYGTLTEPMRLTLLRRVPDALQRVPEALPRVPEAPQRLPDALPRVPEAPQRMPESLPRVPEAAQRVPEVLQRVPEAQQRVPEALPRVSEAQQRVPEAPQRVSEAQPETSGASLWRSFLQGAGIELSIPNGPSPELLGAIGEMMQIAVGGIQRLVSMRAIAKSEMHAKMTMIQVRDNNPLKFSPDATLALQMLLQPPARGFLAGPAALRDALTDLQSHQVGLTAGMRAILEVVLDRLDPAKLETLPVEGSAFDWLRPARRRARLWELYLKQYHSLREETNDNFQRVFGEAFREAYETQVRNFEAASDPEAPEGPEAGGAAR